jgi:RNA recognition motif-containing protein
MLDMRQVAHQPDFASTLLVDNVESSRWSRAPEKASLTCMAIMNIPYTYPESRLQWDVDQLGLPHTGFYYPRDRKSKGRHRGFAFVYFAAPEDAHTFQKLFHNRVLSHPGSSAKCVSVSPSESSTSSSASTSSASSAHGEYCGTSLETTPLPPQRFAAPPGLAPPGLWQASAKQGTGVVDPRAGPVPLSTFEDGTVMYFRLSL